MAAGLAMVLATNGSPVSHTGLIALTPTPGVPCAAAVMQILTQMDTQGSK